MKHIGLLLFLSLAFVITSCSSNEKKHNAKKTSKTHQVKRSNNSKKSTKSAPNSATNQLAKIPLVKGGKGTRFSIDRLNERSGSNDLVKRPYRLKKGEDLKVVGKAVDDVANTVADAVYLKINGSKIIPTNYGGASKGFAKSKNDPRNNAGFQINIKNKLLKKGKNTIQVIIVGKNRKYKFAPPRKYTVIKG